MVLPHRSDAAWGRLATQSCEEKLEGNRKFPELEAAMATDGDLMGMAAKETLRAESEAVQASLIKQMEENVDVILPHSQTPCFPPHASYTLPIRPCPAPRGAERSIRRADE